VNILLHRAARRGVFRTVRELLTRVPRPEVDFRYQDADEDFATTPLETVFYYDHPTFAGFLIKNGATLTENAIFIASDRGKMVLLQQLVKEDGGACLNHLIANSGIYGELTNYTVDMLLTPEHRVDGQDYTRNIALRKASELDKGGHVEWLLDQGADCSKTNEQGETAWELALKNNSYTAISVFARRELERQEGLSDSGNIQCLSSGWELLQSFRITLMPRRDLWIHCGGGNSVSRNFRQMRYGVTILTANIRKFYYA
jgi:hypothetical protein